MLYKITICNKSLSLLEQLITSYVRASQKYISAYFCNYLSSSEKNNDSLAKSLRKTYKRTRSNPPNIENPHAKWAAKPPIFAALFFQFWRGGYAFSHSFSLPAGPASRVLGRRPSTLLFLHIFYKILGKILNIKPKIRKLLIISDDNRRHKCHSQGRIQGCADG